MESNALGLTRFLADSAVKDGLQASKGSSLPVSVELSMGSETSESRPSRRIKLIQHFCNLKFLGKMTLAYLFMECPLQLTRIEHYRKIVIPHGTDQYCTCWYRAYKTAIRSIVSVWVPLADQGRIEVRHKGEASLKLCAWLITTLHHTTVGQIPNEKKNFLWSTFHIRIRHSCEHRTSGPQSQEV